MHTVAPIIVSPRSRVIIDNDFSGDPDDLFQLAHHVLSPSVHISFVVGSHLRPGDPFDDSTVTAENAARVATDLLQTLGRPDIPVIAGSNEPLSAVTEPRPSSAAEAIVAEALRDDTELPLFYCAGGGLTDLASALLIEPAIADRMTVIWIGGREHGGLALPPPGAPGIEYNLAIDLIAGQVVFGHTTVPLWQIPRDTYRQTLMSFTELDLRVAPHGALGELLHRSIADLAERGMRHGFNLGETYIMGDQPLVLLTALQSSFEPDPSSSTYALVPRPLIGDDGGYIPRDDHEPIRVYTTVDTRLLFDDLFLKLARFAGSR